MTNSARCCSFSARGLSSLTSWPLEYSVAPSVRSYSFNAVGVSRTNKRSPALIFASGSGAVKVLSVLRMPYTCIPPSVFSRISVKLRPSAQLPDGTCKCAVNIRGPLFSKLGERSGKIRGASNHKYKIPMEPAIMAGKKKSNIPILSKPMSLATLTTNKLVEVPIVVVIPPSKVAKPIGSNNPEGLALVRIATLSIIGNNNTTIGVLLTTALSSAETTKVINTESIGLKPQSLANTLPTGSNAPVRTMP